MKLWKMQDLFIMFFVFLLFFYHSLNFKRKISICSSYSKTGSYIYIEASPQMPGDAARLLSDWIEPNEEVCIQFWYHMYGSDIGNLSIYLKTNQSEKVVWTLLGNQGDQWRFGQTALNSRDAYKVGSLVFMVTEYLRLQNVSFVHRNLYFMKLNGWRYFCDHWVIS